MGILTRTHSLLPALVMLLVAAALGADTQRSKRQAANQPWNFFRNMYRQRLLNQQRLVNNRQAARLVNNGQAGPLRGPLLMNNQRQAGMNNQRQAGMNNRPFFNNRFVNPPSNSPMNNRFLNNFRNRRRFFRGWRNPRLLNQGPLWIPGQSQGGVVPYTPPQDPTDAPEIINGVIVTELPEPPDPTDPPEIPPGQGPQLPLNNPYANMFWQGYQNPNMMGPVYNPADPTDPPEPPEPTDPPDFPPIVQAPAATTPDPVSQAAPSVPITTDVPSAPPIVPAPPINIPILTRIQPRLSSNQQASSGVNGQPPALFPRQFSSNQQRVIGVNEPLQTQNVGTGKESTAQQVGPWASQPASTLLPLTVVVQETLPKTTESPPLVQPIILILPQTTRSTSVTPTPRAAPVTPSGVSYMYSPRRGYSPTLTMGTNLAPWRQVMWNRMLYNI